MIGSSLVRVVSFVEFSLVPLRKKKGDHLQQVPTGKQQANTAGAERARHCIRDEEVVPRGQPPRPCSQKGKQSEVSFPGCGWLTPPRGGTGPGTRAPGCNANAYAYASTAPWPTPVTLLCCGAAGCRRLRPPARRLRLRPA